MYKILHIPTARLIHVYLEVLNDFIWNLAINKDDIYIVEQENLSDPCSTFPIYFKTKTLAETFISYYRFHDGLKYVPPNGGLVLYSSGPPSHKTQLYHFLVVCV